MTLEHIVIRGALARAMEQAIEVYHQNKENPESNPISRAFDAGRVDGLKQALELVEQAEVGHL